jgi:hypothetical protein
MALLDLGVTANVRPLKPPSEPITDPGQVARLNIHRRDRAPSAN